MKPMYMSYTGRSDSGSDSFPNCETGPVESVVPWGHLASRGTEGTDHRHTQPGCGLNMALWAAAMDPFPPPTPKLGPLARATL